MMKTLSSVAAIILAGASAAACTGGMGDGPQQLNMAQGSISPPTAEVLANERCGVPEYQYLMGQAQTAIPATVRARARVMADDQPATQDFSATRLNFIYAARTGMITRIMCG